MGRANRDPDRRLTKVLRGGGAPEDGVGAVEEDEYGGAEEGEGDRHNQAAGNQERFALSPADVKLGGNYVSISARGRSVTEGEGRERR